MAQGLGVLTPPAEEPGSVLSLHTAGHSYLYLWFQRSDTLFWPPWVVFMYKHVDTGSQNANMDKIKIKVLKKSEMF